MEHLCRFCMVFLTLDLTCGQLGIPGRDELKGALTNVFCFAIVFPPQLLYPAQLANGFGERGFVRTDPFWPAAPTFRLLPYHEVHCDQVIDLRLTIELSGEPIPHRLFEAWVSRFFIAVEMPFREVAHAR